MRVLFLSLPILFALLAPPVCAEVLEGRVVRISDGDTVTVLDHDRQQHKIRLAGIDAPERRQPFGQRAKEFLALLVLGKDVRVEWKKYDRYQRIVGRVFVTSPDSRCPRTGCPKTLDAGLAQITVGLAWHYKKYNAEQSPEDRSRYAFAEAEARVKRVGLWTESNPIPPWEWRRK